MGYGPAQFVTIEQVKQVSKALSALTKEYIKCQYDGKKMMEKGIYPGGWEDNNVIEYLNKMKAFYKQAAKENKAIIIFLN